MIALGLLRSTRVALLWNKNLRAHILNLNRSCFMIAWGLLRSTRVALLWDKNLRAHILNLNRSCFMVALGLLRSTRVALLWNKNLRAHILNLNRSCFLLFSDCLRPAYARLHRTSLNKNLRAHILNLKRSCFMIALDPRPKYREKNLREFTARVGQLQLRRRFRWGLHGHNSASFGAKANLTVAIQADGHRLTI